MVSCSLFCIPFLIRWFVTVFPEAAENTSTFTKKKVSPFEGIKLIAQHKYLLGVLAISTLYEIVATYLDMNFKMLAKSAI